MMTKLREFSKILIIIVAVSFIGLMVFEWGADYSGRSRVQDTVGKVNGNELNYERFNKLYQQLYQNHRARTGQREFDENSLQQIRNQVWEEFVRVTLFEEQMKNLGISVTDSEIVYQIYHYPLEDFKQNPLFQTDDIFDMDKYHASFSNPNIPWQQIEDIYRHQIPYLKLQNIVSNTVRVSDEEALDEFIKQNMKVKVEYLSINNSRFNTTDLKVSDEEIKDFYKDHKEDYKQNEMRELSYVLFPIKTTAKDTAHLFAEFDHIKERVKNGDNFNDLAREYSEDPSAKNNNGDLGYIERGSMVKTFEDAAFTAETGEIVGPIETSFGMHLIKVEDKKVEDGIEKVKASHILMKVTPAPSSITQQEEKARYFSEDARENSFNEEAQVKGYEILTTNLFEERGGFIPGIGINLAILNFTFSSGLNEISNVYRIDEGYIVVSVSAIQEEGYKDLASVERFVANRVRLEKAKRNAREFAENLADQVKSNIPFKEIAEKDETKNVKYNVTGLFNIDGTLPGVGKFVEFNANAFALDEGQISDLIETDRGFYYQKLLEKTAFDSTVFNAQKYSIQNRLLTQKRTQIFNDWYTSLKENADIEDNRKMFNL